MSDEEKWEQWRDAHAEIQKPYGGSVHKHIKWHEGVDHRVAFLGGLEIGRKENILKECATECKIPEGCDVLVRYELLAEENAELKEKHESDKRALKLIVEKGVKLEKDNAELSNSVTELTNSKTELENKVTELKEQNEK